MNAVLVLIVIYLIGIPVAWIYDNISNEKIKNAFKNLGDEYNLDVSELLILCDQKLSENFTIMDRIVPIWNLLKPTLKFIRAESFAYEVWQDYENLYPDLFVKKVEGGCKKDEDGNDKLYFVEYFENDLPVPIFFTYDGEIVRVNKEHTGESYLNLPPDEQMHKLVSLLFDIMNYNDSSINHSLDIREIFNKSLENTLEAHMVHNVPLAPNLVDDEEMKRTRKR